MFFSAFVALILMGCVDAQMVKRVEFSEELLGFIASSKVLSSDVKHYYKYSNDSVSMTFRYNDEELISELVGIHVNTVLMCLLNQDSSITAMNFALMGGNGSSKYEVTLNGQKISQIKSGVNNMKSYFNSVNYLVRKINSRDAGYLSGAIDALNEHSEKFDYQGSGISFLLEFAEDCQRGNFVKCSYADEMRKLFKGTNEDVLLETIEHFYRSCQCPPNDEVNDGSH